MSSYVDVDDVTRCPQAATCERCGQSDSTMEVVTVDLAHLGVACASICQYCLDGDRLPRWDVPSSVRRIGNHCEHLGVTVDDMAESIAADWADYEAER